MRFRDYEDQIHEFDVTLTDEGESEVERFCAEIKTGNLTFLGFGETKRQALADLSKEIEAELSLTYEN